MTPHGGTVDLPRVRQLLGQFDAHLDAHPEIQDRTDAWLAGDLDAVPAEEIDTMPATRPIAVRLDNGTLARLDAYVEALNGKNPGLDLARTTAIKVLLCRALDAYEAGSRTVEGDLEPPPRPDPATRSRAVDPEAYRAALVALQTLADQGLSQTAIAEALNTTGHRGAKGGRWRQSQVSKALAELRAQGGLSHG